MIDRQRLLADLKKQVKLLETDLREQVTAVPTVFERLDAEYKRAFKLGRTAATWAAWRDERVMQAAAAWVLGTVFVRFSEDNGLLQQTYLAGPTLERMTHAEESQEEFFRLNPAETDRGWVLESFTSIGSTQAGKLLFDEQHNAAYHIPVSADAAKVLIDFWRRRNEDGVLVHDFADPDWDTEFLGDLYQNLSELARKTYALLQTPDFVREFILDLTLEPAIAEFGHESIKMIDPACGSGHFLLSGFQRLVNLHVKLGVEPASAVRQALLSTSGVDINPFAVAIARFRLLIAAIKAAHMQHLWQAAQYEFPVNVAVGDSLLKHRQVAMFGDDEGPAYVQYSTEDIDDHPGILNSNTYHVVVGNPPYITVKDKKLNEYYRSLYKVCTGRYAQTVPFSERFFDLAKKGAPDGRGAGYVGQITANSFMKREFGRKLIEEFFGSEVALTHIVDTSGAYIPDHGTPTVILIGRRRKQQRGALVRRVLGKRGEPTTPANPAQGLVWRAILAQLDNAGSNSEWVTVEDSDSFTLKTYPWSLSGGGSGGLVEHIQRSSVKRLRDRTDGVFGFAGFSAADDAFYMTESWHKRMRTPYPYIRTVISGDDIRDWLVGVDVRALAPYDKNGDVANLDFTKSWTRHLWCCRQQLGSLGDFSGKTRFDNDVPWWSWYRWTQERASASRTICMAKVSTSNHAFLNNSGYVTNQHVPAGVLSADVTDEEARSLVAVVNSSLTSFWLKQVSQSKGNGGVGGGISDEAWEHRYEFTGTGLQELPLPRSYPTRLAIQLASSAGRLTELTPSTFVQSAVPNHKSLAEAQMDWRSTRARMIAQQEELDWQIYSLYGLLDDLRAPESSVPALRLGERAFEILLARRVAAGETHTQWFARHGSTPITELPKHWPTDYAATVERRIAVIESNHSIGLIERPECKRRWSTVGWDAMQDQALRSWLLNRCETHELWFQTVDGTRQPRPLTASQLADELRRDVDVLAVAELYAPGKNFSKVIADLVADEHVPYLVALRYKDAGLDKRADWEEVWDLQRAEDAALNEPEKKKIRDAIPVPPKYGSGDFLMPSYWRNRGKLDVPKERFISYPLASPDGDQSLLLGWAGWDHREQAQALATLMVDREQTEAWSADRLTPLLAGLREVLPWVKQWHGDFDPLYGGSPADVYDAFLSEVIGRLQITDRALTSWRPPKAARGRRTGSAA